ncbi:MAG: hypothetical protein WDA60_11785 [Acidimicrobiia bacterium]|jgi:hypothetical protein
MSRVTARLRTPRAQFFAAGAVGGVVAFLVFAWFALAGKYDLLRTESLANFYEVQARAWLHGRWDAGPSDFLFERFNVDGKFFTYFGPAPALLRLPFVLFTHSLDGRLSRVSMMLAFVVLLVSSTALAWQGRKVLRGDGPPTRGTLVAAGGFVFLSGCGTTALFMAAKTWVYHEAILWGAAWAVASFAFLVAYLLAPSRRLLVGASATAALAFLSRGSVGIGPVAALGLVFGARLCAWAWERFRKQGGELFLVRWLGLGPTRENTRWWPVAIALAVPVVLYSYVNFVKFGTLFGTPPYDLQDELAARPSRQAALAANHGSLFGFHYAPTILLAYFRPDGFTIDRFFPWFSFAGPPKIIGDTQLEAANFSASVTITSLVFVVLVLLGVWACIRAPRLADGAPTPAVFRIPLIAAAFGCVGMFVLAFLEERYLGDIIPLLVVGGALGLWWVARLLSGRSRAVKVAAVSALVVLSAWSVWATASLTLLEQREFGPLVPTRTRAALLDFQTRLHETFPGGNPSRVYRGGLALPAPAKAGSLYVAGDCDGLYWSNGRFWHPVEQTPRTGRFVLDLTLDDAPAGTKEPLLSATDERGSSILWVEHLARDRVRFVYEWTGENQSLIEGVAPDEELIGQRTSDPIPLPAGEPITLAVRMDPAGYVGVRTGGQVLMSTFAPVATGRAEVGVQDATSEGETTLQGTVDLRRPPTPICDRLTDR